MLQSSISNGVNMFNASEELLERLRSPEVTADVVMEYLRLQRENLIESGFNLYPPGTDSFFKADVDLSIFTSAIAWWPKGDDVPAQYAAPTLFQLLWGYHEGPSFLQRLTDRSAPVVTWLQETGRSVDNPNESELDRKRRTSADRVREHRIRKAGGADAAQSQAVMDAYKAYQSACAARKAAYDALTPAVNAAYDAWQSLKKR